MSTGCSGNLYLHDIVLVEREVVGGHHAGAGQEHRAVWKPLRPTQIGRELLKASLDVADEGLARKRLPAVSMNRAADRPLAHLVLGCAQVHPRRHCTRAVVHLRLRQVQKILAFDVARAHVVADRTAGNLAARVQHECQLGLWHAPAGIAPDADGVAGGHDFLGNRLEKDFRAIGVVHPVVRRCAEVGFFHARRFAAQVGHARRPHFLPLYWRRKSNGGDLDARQLAVIHPIDRSHRIGSLEELGQRGGTRRAQVAQMSAAIVEPDVNGVTVDDESADFHGRHAIDWTVTGSSTRAATPTGLRKARPNPAN
jgi:hypothetical protein